MQYQTFLINLDKSVGRLRNCQRILSEQDIQFERVSATYGADLTQSQIDDAYTGLISNVYHKRLNVGEVGCYLSHRQCWKKIVERELDFALILEDDFVYQGDHFSHVLELIKSMTEPWFYIKLSSEPKLQDMIDSRTQANFTVCRLRKVPTRTCAQVVSLEGAKRLLATTQPFSRPVDVDLQYWWEKNIIVHSVSPPPFRSDQDVTSEIQTLARLGPVEKRAFKRVINKVAFHYHSYVEAKKVKNRDIQK